jgi:hypothetical protein
MVTKQRKNKDKAPSAKVVWRISAAAPLGEYVRSEPEPAAEATVAPVAAAKPKHEAGTGETGERGWHRSSLELVDGVEMHEEPLDTLPDDLFDLFVKKDPPPV